MKKRYLVMALSVFLAAASTASAAGIRTWAGTEQQEGQGTVSEEYDQQSAAQSVVLDAAHFPDANFRKALAEKLNVSEGATISADTIAGVTSLDVSEKSIADLTGIEYFTGITDLFCDNNELTSLDLSKNVSLAGLYCSYNKLSSLNVSKNPALGILWCNHNELSSLDVSGNTALVDLFCSDNQLTTLDVSKNTELNNLNCYGNKLTNLDASQNAKLGWLICSNNQLTGLDVSKNAALTWIQCSDNKLSSLDVSNNAALDTLECSNNELTSLDVSKNAALKTLTCQENKLMSLNLSKNTELEGLNCDENELVCLDLSKNQKFNEWIPTYGDGDEEMPVLGQSRTVDPVLTNGTYVLDLKALDASFDPAKISDMNAAGGEWNAENGTITFSSNPAGSKITYNYDTSFKAAGNINVTLSVAGSMETEGVNMYRLYNPNSGEHFYTASEKEKNDLIGYGWSYENIGWTAPKDSGDPVYRLYNPNAGDHHYTLSADERDFLVKVGWNYEGVGWYSAPDTEVPLYRLYNPNAIAGAHHYTTSASERDFLISVGWRNENIGWYGLK